jgi:hypothetical protein
MDPRRNFGDPSAAYAIFVPMSTKRRAVFIRNAHGNPYTSRVQALKYMTSGRARYVDEFTIEMIVDDFRHVASCPERQEESRVITAPPPHSPSISIIPRPQRIISRPGQTFLHYPHANQTSTSALHRKA